jgi:transcriptional regulator with AAA-type ATPase domain
MGMGHARGVDETASLVTDTGSGPDRAPSWYLVLALEATRPAAGAQRVSLADLDEVAVGRGPARAFVRDGRRARLELDDRFQSKNQCRFVRAGAGWELVDAASKNGTRVRGQRTTGGALEDGDVVEAGASFFVIRATAAPAPDLTVAPSTDDVLRTLHAPLGGELALLGQLARSGLPILVHGESGAGKEILARSIHALSQRRGPLVPVNCGALPAGLAEAELFGAKRGAYSGATEDRPGLVRTAEGGTLFLDEIADLPLPAQAALLRFVQEGEVRSVGAHRTGRVDTRIVAATHRDLDALVRKEAFRHDLAARLRGHTLVVPPLRARREDLGLLVAELLVRADPTPPPRPLEPAAARALFAYHWPENVRELDHALRYALARAREDITVEDLPDAVRRPGPLPPTAVLPAVGAHIDRRSELGALVAEHDGNVSAIARALKTSRTQVRRLLERYGLASQLK